MRVKICGITNLRDAEWALRCGADAIGFVFAESPRRIRIAEAKKITKAVGPWMSTVGVFVNESMENVIRAVSECRLTCVQLHGDEGVDYTKRLKLFKVIKAFRVGENFDFSQLKNYDADAFLFDAKTNRARGGTGQTFDWAVLKGKKIARPLVVSGGLNPKNVRLAIRLLSPYGVDASSGVEKKAGVKDPRLVKEFIQNAKQK